MAITPRPPSFIHSWHAHVYFGAEMRDAAWALREVITTELGSRVQVGRFHEKPVGPHPAWTFQVAFDASEFAHVASWLALNHGTLDVLFHPNTGDALSDHRDAALWLGKSYPLILEALID
ncbi:DOPA 4,5-dioxygenase family protein [Hydrogenophaga sp.]|uniref:DOPA 4,5-dioxygenase family protein n=1 Tax=Hydrogenophaga sp. TaxID=1904254 RepID=UPI003F712940